MARLGRDIAKRLSIAAAGAVLLAGGAQAQTATPSSQSPSQNPSPKNAADTVETVVVTGHKNSVTRSIEGTLYDQTKNPVAQTGTAADVLNTVPTVNVSPDGNVSLRGNGNVQVYINGKPSAALTGDSRGLTLQSMPGGDIAGIEVITNPSAKYGAEGAPIINIVLKKDRTPGANATLTASAGNEGRKNATLNANLTRRAFSLHLNAGVREDVRPIRDATTTVETDPVSGVATKTEQTLSAAPRRRSFSLTASGDYTVSDEDTLSVELSWKGNSSKNTIDAFNQDFDAANALTSAFDQRSAGPRRQTDTSERADFTHEESSGEKWSLTLANSESFNYRDKSYDDIFSFPAMPDQIARVLANSDQRLLQLSGDAFIPTDELSGLSFGFDFRRIALSLSNLDANVDPVTGAETVNPGLTNQADMVRRIGAGYVTYQQGFGRLTVLAGLRYEAAQTSIDDGTPLSRSQSNLNPTLHLLYQTEGGDKITANISHTSQRPNLSDLNPFVSYIDAENESSGNPDLKPQSVTAGEIGYEFATGEADHTLTAYVRQSNHTVTDYTAFVAQDVLLTTKRNGGEGLSYGIDASSNGPLLPGLKYEASANLFYARLEAPDLNGVLDNSGVSYNVKAALDYSPTERDQIRLDANFNGQSITAQGTRSGTTSFDLSWLRHITPKLMATLRAYDMADGAKVLSITRTSIVFRTDDGFVNGRQVFLGLQYRY
jgi:outer membrane receptor for ferrienterochelin and colicin